MHSLRFRDEPVEFSMLAAEAQVGGVAFELIQPLAGRSPYEDWLESHGEGLHHVACAVQSKRELDAFQARLRELGVETLTSGRLGDDLEFYYFDTRRC